MIIVRLTGGLGNQMFQYALGRVLSVKNKTTLVFNVEAYLDQTSRPFRNITLRQYDLDVFNIDGRITSKNEIPFLYRMYGKGKFMLVLDAIRRRVLRHKGYESSVQKFNPKVLELGPDTYLDGYWQSPKYFAGFEDTLRKDFSLKKELPENIKILMKEIKEKDSLCIHVRRGDFVGNNFHEVVSKEYYEKGIEKIKGLANIEKIYVFSDDIKWCEENMKFEFPVMFVDEKYSGEKSEGHLFLMSSSKYFIIPNSSFSWWGAWLSEREGKIVVVPSKWFNDISINTSDLTPKEWIKI